VIATAVGLIVQLGAWGSIAGRRQLSGRALAGVSAGLVVAIVSTTIVRELMRLTTVDTLALADSHMRSAEAGGAIVFAFFLVVNAIVIGWCIKTAQKPSSAESSSSESTN
jgi:hypothetical protein